MNHIQTKIDALESKVKELQESVRVDKMRKEQADKDIKFSEKLIREYTKYIEDLKREEKWRYPVYTFLNQMVMDPIPSL